MLVSWLTCNKPGWSIIGMVVIRVSRDIRLKQNGTEYLPFEANICFGHSLQKIANICLFAILRMRNFQANIKRILCKYDAKMKWSEINSIIQENERKKTLITNFLYPTPQCWARLSLDIRLKRNGTEYSPLEAKIRFSYSLQKLANIRLFADLWINKRIWNEVNRYAPPLPAGLANLKKEANINE